MAPFISFAMLRWSIIFVMLRWTRKKSSTYRRIRLRAFCSSASPDSTLTHLAIAKLMKGAILAVLLASTSFVAALPNDPLINAAAYYYEKHQFNESLKLWETLAKRYPNNVQALLKLADHELLIYGRQKARETLMRAIHTPSISNENRILIREKLSQINSLFLTDDGQANYLQALSRFKLGDYTKSENLLQAANQTENINTSVLRELIRCHIALNAIEQYIETLKALLTLEPYEQKAKLALIDAYLYQDRPTLAVPLLMETGDSGKTRLAIALFETGQQDKATHLLKDLSHGPSPHPIVWYYLGKSAEVSKRTNATHYYQLFLTTSKNYKPESPWDPFHIAARTEEISKRVF